MVGFGGRCASPTLFEIAERQTVKERPALKIHHRAQTNALFSAFYELDDSLQSLVDEQTLLPHKLLSERRVGIKREYIVVLFDQPARKATVTTNGRAETHNLLPGVHDGLSWLYFFRSLTLPTAGSSTMIPI
jgi:hypothetical protein